MARKATVLSIRLDPPLHDLIRVAAATRRQSVNAWIAAAVRGAILREAAGDKGGPLAAALDRTGEGR